MSAAAGTPCPTCGHPAGFPPTLVEYRGGCIDPCHAVARAAPAAPVEAPFIASRPELGGHLEGKMADCPLCAPALPVEHPASWRWRHDDDGAYLEDANGNPVFGGCPRGWFVDQAKSPEPRAARVRALTEAAPELADELRWLVDNSVPTWDERGARRERWVALLARIDAAAKAGR